MSLIRRSFVSEDPFVFARNLFSTGFADPWFANQSATAWQPDFAVKESADSFVITADVPGLTEDEIEVSQHNDVVTIAASRTQEQTKEGERYTLLERKFGSFARSFRLPESADEQNISADLQNGVFRLTIGKKAVSQPRKIAIGK